MNGFIIQPVFAFGSNKATHYDVYVDRVFQYTIVDLDTCYQLHRGGVSDTVIGGYKNLGNAIYGAYTEHYGETA